MKTTQWVSFTFPESAGHEFEEYFEALTPQDAMAMCRQKYPDCDVTGGGRLFNASDVQSS